MYQQVANVLRDRIAYGIYPKDELLPPEMLLLSEFNVSRHTIREAMRMLVGEGLIERSPGRGTIVSPPSRTRGNWGIKSLNDLIGEFKESQVAVLKRASISARRFPQIADILSTDRKSSMFLVQRIISVDDGPIALHTAFTHTKYVSRIPKACPHRAQGSRHAFGPNRSRSTRCWIFPVAVRGISLSPMNVTLRGRLYPAIRSRHHSITPCSVSAAPSLGTITACATSPHFSCGTPTTATSFTPGHTPRMFSISLG